MSDNLPLVIEPTTLESWLAGKEAPKRLLIVDLSNPDSYQRMHVPGAVNCAYSSIIASRPPVMGLVPNENTLSGVFSQLGLTPDTHVIAYDDEGNGKASRLIFTLHSIGHTSTSLLNGGINAWAAEGHELESGINTPEPSDYVARLDTSKDSPVATRSHIEANLDNDDVQIVDTRSAAEYAGVDMRAAKGGHIPGAIHFDWTEAMDRMNNLRHKPAGELQALLQSRGLSSHKPTIVYCQTHHRSAHTYVALKNLGYATVKGYPGAWSEWGNLADTPVE